VLALFVFTRHQVWRIERLYPPRGEWVDIDGSRLHVVHHPGPDDPDLPPILFIHGASGNLCDPMTAFLDTLDGRAELLFVDRPGHGWSDRGGGAHHHPDGQARAIAALLDRKKIDRAIVVGHSFGGAVALSMALEAPDKVAGLLLLSAASHPWPGGIDWHYTVTATPVVGHLFAALIAMPAGLQRMGGAARRVFLPNAMPHGYLRRAATALVLRPKAFRDNAIDVSNLFDHVVRTARRVFLPNAMPHGYLRRAATALVLRPKAFRDNAIDVSNLFDHVVRTARRVFLPNAMPHGYLRRAATALVLRPKAFRDNAIDVSNLFDHVVRTAPRYVVITAPTVVITGNRDDVVSPDIHSVALARDIPEAQLLRIKGVGHKPDFGATELCVAALEKLSGQPVDLAAMAAQLEQRLTAADQATGDEKPARGKADSADQIPVMPSDPM